VFVFSQRRHFIPLVAIFFLTLPDTTAQQIGFYTGVGFIASLIFEVPSSYFADRIGHKITLIIAKLFMVISTLMFIIATNFWYFVLGSMFMSLSTSFSGGVGSAFMHNTLLDLKREKEYTKIMSRIGAYASLFSGILIVLLPFLTKTSILLPFKICIVIDVVGFIVVCTLKSPQHDRDTQSISFHNIVKTLRTAVKPGFYPLAIFTSAISGFLVADNSYRYVYLQSLGYPIIFIGFVMGLSRLVWFLLAQNIKYLQKLSIHTLATIDLFLFPIAYVLVALFDNPYVVGVFFSIVVGYMWARDQLYTTEFIDHYITNQKYKATMLSVTTQIDYVFEMIVAFTIGIVMQKSYKLGFFTLGIVLFCILIIIYFRVPKKSPSTRGKPVPALINSERN